MAELKLQAWRFGPWPQCAPMYSTSLHDTADVSLLCRGEPEPEASLALFCTSFPPLQSDEGLRSISIRKLVPTSRQTWNFLPFVKLEMAFLFLKCKFFPSYNLITIIFEDSLLFKPRQTSKCFLFLHHLLLQWREIRLWALWQPVHIPTNASLLPGLHKRHHCSGSVCSLQVCSSARMAWGRTANGPCPQGACCLMGAANPLQFSEHNAIFCFVSRTTAFSSLDGAPPHPGVPADSRWLFRAQWC